MMRRVSGQPWRLSGAAVVLVAGHAPLVWLHLQNLMRFRPHYEFLPLVLVAIAILTWIRWPRTAVAANGWAGGCARGLTACGALILFAATLLGSPWLGQVALALSLGGFCWLLTGQAFWRDLFPVWLLLGLTIPPGKWDQHLVAWMQGITVQTTSRLLDAAGVLHALRGNVIALPQRELLVAEACGGVHSQLVLVAASAVWAVVWRRPLLPAAMLLGSAFWWAGLANLLRVFLVGWACAVSDLDLATGIRHELVGYGVVLLGFAFLISTDQLLCGIWAPIHEEGRAAPENPLSQIWNRWLTPQQEEQVSGSDTGEDAHTVEETVGLPLATARNHDGAGTSPQEVPRPSTGRGQSYLTGVALLVAAASGLLYVVATARTTGWQQLAGTIPLDEVAAATLPGKLGDWSLVSSEDDSTAGVEVVGAHRRIWIYQARENLLRIAVDYPFEEWHDLPLCYTATGWQVVQQSRTETDFSGHAPLSVQQVHMRRSSGEYGYLWYALLDRKGQAVSPPADTWSQRLWGRLRHSPVLVWLGDAPQATGGDMARYQVQQFFIATDPQDSETVRRLRATFVAVCQQHLAPTLATP